MSYVKVSDAAYHSILHCLYVDTRVRCQKCHIHKSYGEQSFFVNDVNDLLLTRLKIK